MHRCAMPYGLVLPVAVGWLPVKHCRADAPSERSKCEVAVLTTGASMMTLTWPPAAILAALLLAVTGAYVIVHKDVTTSRKD